MAARIAGVTRSRAFGADDFLPLNIRKRACRSQGEVVLVDGREDQRRYQRIEDSAGCPADRDAEIELRDPGSIRPAVREFGMAYQCDQKKRHQVSQARQDGRGLQAEYQGTEDED